MALPLHDLARRIDPMDIDGRHLPNVERVGFPSCLAAALVQ
jgi:hypothetical protein